MTETPTRLAYRLEPDDLARLLAAERRHACRCQCVGWAWSLATLVPIVLLLGFGAGRMIGPRAVFVATGAALGVLISIVVTREWDARRRCRLLARDLGLPRDVVVDVTPDGLVQEPDADGLGRAFHWADVYRVDHLADLTVVRLRVADSALLIPDRAFASPADRDAFARSLGDRSRVGADGSPG